MVDNIKLFEGLKDKSESELSPEELFQLHLTKAASKLSQSLEIFVDSETCAEKLTMIESHLK